MRHTANRRIRGLGCVCGFAILFSASARVLTALAGAAGSVADCGLPSARPLWIDYGEGSVPPEIRAIFAGPVLSWRQAELRSWPRTARREPRRSTSC